MLRITLKKRRRRKENTEETTYNPRYSGGSLGGSLSKPTWIKTQDPIKKKKN